MNIFYVQFSHTPSAVAISPNSVTVSAVVLEHITYQKQNNSLYIVTNSTYPLFLTSKDMSLLKSQELTTSLPPTHTTITLGF